ncbi:LysR family transcriptional regulator [Amycolatopsis sp. NPDC059090]|uniref:LysR family transcriptional regulator n=1 Tax=Amycolatopsis sp. NPDC059090 TaxID=3346723 RepID=UPI00366A69EE
MQYFVTAAETSSISNAAKRLHISQSTLSAAIQRLEQQLGTQLFLRQRAKGIVLTSHGRRLLAQARGMLRSAREFQQYREETKEEVRGHLDIGCFTTLTPFLVPPLVRRMRECHPQLSIRIHEADVDPLHRMLREGACEIALTYNLGLSDELVFTELVRLRPHVLMADSHPLARSGSVRLADLAGEAFVILDLPHTHQLQKQLISQTRSKLPPAAKTTSFETMRGLVAGGVGVAIFNQRVATPMTYDGGRVSVVEILDDVPTISMGVTMMADSRPSRSSRALVTALRSILARSHVETPAATPRRDGALAEGTWARPAPVPP